MLFRVVFFDKVKNWMMPFDQSKYSGIDYYFRAAVSSVICSSIILLITYPFDLIHTRTSCDMS